MVEMPKENNYVPRQYIGGGLPPSYVKLNQVRTIARKEDNKLERRIHCDEYICSYV